MMLLRGPPPPVEAEIPVVQLSTEKKRKKRSTQADMLVAAAPPIAGAPAGANALVMKAAAKKQKRVDDKASVVAEGWRKLEKGKAVFLLPLQPHLMSGDFAQFNDAWCGVNIRHLKPINVLSAFITPALVKAIIADIPQESLFKNGNQMIPTAQKIWQALAIEARMTSQPKAHFKEDRRASINESRDHFNSLNPHAAPCIGYDHASCFLANAYIMPGHYKILNASFQVIFARLGACVAGDEKLWFCTGSSDFIRKVPSKPGGVGLWMYQLCLTLPDGTTFCLYFRMHHNRDGPVPVADVVKEWADALEDVGREADGETVNVGCALVFDSYYATKDVFTMLRNRGRAFTSSATKERKGSLAGACLHFTDGASHTRRDSRPGDFYGLYNECNGSTFVYYFDGDKGVGEKFNYSWGFRISTDPADLKAYKQVTPVYDYYKQLFSICDWFNKGLNGSRYPFRRGKEACTGMMASVCALGAHNDFCKSVIWKNTYNAYHAMKNPTGDKSIVKPAFSSFLADLADDMYKYSQVSANFVTAPAAPAAPAATPPPVEPRVSGRARTAKVPQEAPGAL